MATIMRCLPLSQIGDVLTRRRSDPTAPGYSFDASRTFLPNQIMYSGAKKTSRKSPHLHAVARCFNNRSEDAKSSVIAKADCLGLLTSTAGVFMFAPVSPGK